MILVQDKGFDQRNDVRPIAQEAHEASGVLLRIYTSVDFVIEMRLDVYPDWLAGAGKDGHVVNLGLFDDQV